MRRLILLFVALALLLWGRSLLLGDGVAPEIALRDGLLIVLLGLVIFAVNSASPPRSDVTASPDNLSSTGTIGAAIGFGLALAAGGWLLLADRRRFKRQPAAPLCPLADRAGWGDGPAALGPALAVG
jgi:hypothetical protein